MPWLPGNQTASLPSSSAQFWEGQNLTWSIIARVNGKAYNLFGVSPSINGTQPASVVAGSYTSTHSLFNVTAGGAAFTLDFFSPVSPKNYVRQSLPFSYLTVSVSGTNSSTPCVQIYSDIDDTWTGQSASTTWNYTTAGTTSVYQLSANGAKTYSQNDEDMALWGASVFASSPSTNSSLSAASGDPNVVRGGFVSNGTLSGAQPGWTVGGVVGLAHDLGSIPPSGSSVTFAIGYVRAEAVNYLGDAQVAYYTTEYGDTVTAVSAFLDDFDAAQSESLSIDSSIATAAAAAGGNEYTNIVSLALRQVFGAIDLVVPAGGNSSNMMAFLKEISSDGNIQTIDVIYPAFPVLYAMDPEWIRFLLEPVIQYLAMGRWPQPYCIHDLGNSYPNATGHDDGVDEEQPVEESGNILLLAYAYTYATSNTAWAASIAPTIAPYADYLIANGLYPAQQLSTDDGAGFIANQTNLAIKAAVALAAFGNLTSNATYTAAATSFAKTIYTDGVGLDANRTHFTLQYGNDTTWTLTFNLYPDVLLGLDVFPAAAYALQASFYPSVRQPAGVPLDSNVNWSKTDWMLFAAATTPANHSTTAMFVDDINTFISNGLNDVPFGDRYFTQSDDTGDVAGEWFGFEARPVQGGEFALLAENGPGSLLA
ncbi:MAG: hypothetical protein M1819_006482 [Sarea resinae]|nr:MAG: hypothetical protein M1819_006482 [Sarea resinae]